MDLVDFEKLALLDTAYASWFAQCNGLQSLWQRWSLKLSYLHWPWFRLNSHGYNCMEVHNNPETKDISCIPLPESNEPPAAAAAQTAQAQCSGVRNIRLHVEDICYR